MTLNGAPKEDVAVSATGVASNRHCPAAMNKLVCYEALRFCPGGELTKNAITPSHPQICAVVIDPRVEDLELVYAGATDVHHRAASDRIGGSYGVPLITLIRCTSMGGPRWRHDGGAWSRVSMVAM